MKKQAVLFLSGILVFFIACNKDDAAVLVRVNNATSLELKEVLTSNRVFKNVHPSETTSYQSFDNAIKPPTALLVTTNNDTLLAGLYYSDALGVLSTGKYTMKIYNDTTLVSGYNCVYIKD